MLVLVLGLSIACSTKHPDQWLNAWSETSGLNTPRAGSAAVIYKDWIFVLGGVDGKVFLDTVERAHISSDGSLGAWQIVATMPQARGFFDAIVIGNYIYVVGGGNGANGKNLLQSVIRAGINADGNLSDWETQQPLLIPRRCVKVFSHQDRLYALGGFGGTLLDTVEYTTIDSSGKLSSWQLLEQKMTTPRYINAVKEYDNNVYVLGGHHPSKGSGLATTETASLNQTHLTWKSAAQLKQGRYALSALHANEQLFVLGGISGLEYLSSVEVLRNGLWENTTELPYAMANFSALSNGNMIYVIGGVTRDKYLSSTFYAQVDQQGQIGIFVGEADLEHYKNMLDQTPSTPANVDLPNAGHVLDVIQSDPYTYVEVFDGNERYWLAGPVTKLQKNDEIRFSQGVFMSDFYSRSLDRRFPKILFVSQLQRL